MLLVYHGSHFWKFGGKVALRGRAKDKFEPLKLRKQQLELFCVEAKNNGKNDITIITMKEEKGLPNFELTGEILGCCFEVMKELGPGFLERVYKNALLITMKQKGLGVEVEQPFEVNFRGKVIGRYNADLVVNETVIVELKCCDSLVREHQAQLFNYLKVAQLPVGLLVNFRRRQLEWKRLQSNEDGFDAEEATEEPVPF